MRNTRTLTLRREVLTELDDNDLSRVAAAEQPMSPNTRFSCLTYISCYPRDCEGRPTEVCA